MCVFLRRFFSAILLTDFLQKRLLAHPWCCCRTSGSSLTSAALLCLCKELILISRAGAHRHWKCAYVQRVAVCVCTRLPVLIIHLVFLPPAVFTNWDQWRGWKLRAADKSHLGRRQFKARASVLTVLAQLAPKGVPAWQISTQNVSR